MVGFFFEIVGECGSGRFVNDMEDVEVCNLISIFGRLMLGVVEVGRDSDNSVFDRFGEIGFGGFFYFVEDEVINLRRRVVLVMGGNLGIVVGVLDDFVRNFFDVVLNFSVGEFVFY